MVYMAVGKDRESFDGKQLYYFELKDQINHIVRKAITREALEKLQHRIKVTLEL